MVHWFSKPLSVRQMQLLCASLLAGFVLCGALQGLCWGRTQLDTGAALCADTLRLHIRAASDAVSDQSAKLRVRDAVLSVMQYIYENIMYAELNTKSDYCMECGYAGEIKIVTDRDGKLVWECPNCGNRDQNKMSVARRTCGYIGTQFWNQGRTQEIKERVLHL